MVVAYIGEDAFQAGAPRAVWDGYLVSKWQWGTHIGEDAFQAGIRQYLATHKYSNAATADLWEALSVSSGQDVNALMGKWTTQTGYPVVTVSQAANGLTIR